MLASGSFHTTGALVAGISQPSFSAFLPKVLDAIIGLTPRHICLPNTLQKQQETKQGFYLISGFPHVLGAIDCTHVRLVPPASTEHLNHNRKHTHSINVQAIVDHQGLITNIVAKYPRSVHDSFIFLHSTINQHFQDGKYGNGLLVAANMTPNQVREFQRWAMRYQHILLVESGFRRMARQYRHERASGAWRAFPQGGPTLPTTATTSTTTSSTQVAPPTARTVVPTSAVVPGPSIATALGQPTGLGSTPPKTSSAGTQTAPAPTVDPAAFHEMERKMDRVLRKISNLRWDVRHINRRVKSIKRTLRRTNL
ncbi:hypothetical protein NDU88_001145 [Pleurodeles waltl]|uniref:DDE Tnp4 domain-containing protein n=1 Tax=Pleurodeles waltl TaxID=8319 RepID=A0AAV7THX8_PLEWA|nr:hypothetical protein NDU88_001145 [Pleurodeles waltl]